MVFNDNNTLINESNTKLFVVNNGTKVCQEKHVPVH